VSGDRPRRPWRARLAYGAYSLADTPVTPAPDSPQGHTESDAEGPPEQGPPEETPPMPEHDALVRWPKTEAEATATQMIRALGNDAQLLYLEKWRLLEAAPPDERTPEQVRLHLMTVTAEVSTIGLMHALRVLREVDPGRADAFARDHWDMCDAGDSFGEWLWEWLVAEGVDPAQIKLPEEPGAGQ
jgi:hypothetical protein